MKMNMQKTIIATSIAALFMAPVAAFAKDNKKWEYHEDQWDQVKPYGNVPLSQDSASAWGPWTEFAQPAAGGAAVSFQPPANVEHYRPLVKPTPTPPVDNFCNAGAWCGYIAYFNMSESASGDGEDNSYDAKISRPYPGRIALTLSPDSPLGDGGEGSGKVSWLISPLGGYPGPNLADSGAPLNAYFYQGLGNFDAWRYTSSDNAWDGAEGFGVSHPYSSDLPTSNPEVTAGMVQRELWSYIEGNNGSWTESWKVSGGVYVAGIVTPQSHMDIERQLALEQGPGYVQAQYVGNSVDLSGLSVPVTIGVDFAKSSWSGSWNNGQDGLTLHGADSDGNKIVGGQVGFTVTGGTINGANLSATSANLSAIDGTVTGTVTGSFFGQQASSIGGVHDIVKTTEGYSASSSVGVFLVDKVTETTGITSGAIITAQPPLN